MRSIFSTITAAAVVLLALGLSVVSQGKQGSGVSGDQGDKHQVTIDNFNFRPSPLTVPAGTTLTWVNRDDVPHNVVSTEKKFKSPVLDTDEQFSYKFTDPGAYEYFCSIHPKMTGKIVVQ